MNRIAKHLRRNQQTLASEITYVGRALHSGERVSMKLRPAEVDTGIQFIRRDVAADEAIVPALWNNVVDTNRCNTLANKHGIRVRTTEHLLAALHVSGIDNVIVELDGPEIPIMDGSAEPFMLLLRLVGVAAQGKPRRAILISRPITVAQDDRHAVLLPSPTPRVTVEIDFPSPVIGSQKLSLPIDDEVFVTELAPARTFGFAAEAPMLKAAGYARGATLRNTVVVDGPRVVNEDGLRFPDEFVRHKMLDAIGDLALAGAPIIGHFSGFKVGHQLNLLMLRELFAERDAWSYVYLSDTHQALNRADLKVVDGPRRRASDQTPPDDAS